MSNQETLTDRLMDYLPLIGFCGLMVVSAVGRFTDHDCPPCTEEHHVVYDQVLEHDPDRPCGCPATGTHYYDCKDNQ